MNNDLIARYYSEHVNELRNFFTTRVKDTALSEDMAQDVFVRILSCEQIATEQTLPSLVFTVARRLLTDYYRHLTAVKRYREALDYSLTYCDSTQETCYAHELAAIVERGIERLPEPCREIYRLHIYNGLKVSRIADETHLNYKVAERRLGIARREVRGYVRRVV